MPIVRENYPENWPEFSKFIRFERAGGRCECAGECGADHTTASGDPRCSALNGQLGFCFRHNGECGHVRIVVLTTAHLWQHGCTCEPVKCANPKHVKAMCQACHLRYDLKHHVRNAARTRRRKKQNLELFEDFFRREIIQWLNNVAWILGTKLQRMSRFLFSEVKINWRCV